MSVALDAQSTSQTTTTGTGTTGATHANMTVGTGGSNYALVATCMFDSQGIPGSLAATWDSGGTNQSMAQIASITSVGANATSGYGIYFFGLVAPTSGNKTFKVTWGSQTNEVHIYLFSFTGVNQTGGATTFPHTATASGTTATSLSATLTSATGNGYVDGSQCDTTISALTGTPGYTQNVGPQIASGANEGAGAASVSLSTSFSAGTQHIFLLGVDIAASASSSNPFQSNIAFM